MTLKFPDHGVDIIGVPDDDSAVLAASDQEPGVTIQCCHCAGVHFYCLTIS